MILASFVYFTILDRAFSAVISKDQVCQWLNDAKLKDPVTFKQGEAFKIIQEGGRSVLIRFKPKKS